MRERSVITVHVSPVVRFLLAAAAKFASVYFGRLFNRGHMRKITQSMMPLLMVSAAAGLILAILGPYGTSNLSFLSRLLYWVGLCIAGGFGAGAADLLFKAFEFKARPWQFMALRSFTSALAVFVILLGFSIYAKQPVDAASVIMMFLYIWVIAFVISLAGFLGERGKTDTIGDQSDAPPALLERLPVHLRGAEIYALSAEDHYVRVHTSKGDELILMRLTDAITETAPLAGMTTHRSWWVAEAGVKTAGKAGGKISLTLHNNAQAPVSRNNVKAVRDAGWV